MTYDLPEFLKSSTYVVIDTESLGLTATPQSVIEIGALRVSHGCVSGALTLLVQQPDEALAAGAEALRVNQIDPDEVRRCGMPPDRAAAALNAFAHGTAVVCGHNVGFDAEQLSALDSRLKALFTRLLCTQALAWGATPKCYALKLTKVCEEFGVPTGQAHRAFGDVLSTAALLPAVLRRHTFSSIEDAAERCKVWRGEVRAYFAEKGR